MDFTQGLLDIGGQCQKWAILNCKGCAFKKKKSLCYLAIALSNNWNMINNERVEMEKELTKFFEEKEASRNGN